ncbi:dihydrofolate reductase family protein [Agrilutibacter solisilvae]|uniref:Dihydrofolate reductase family protein n=1 Tax=Agrilutibacter solisilvae TaxID=2763317 RepID=A0A974XZT1_9GAMM|nr:dihydrofolate reductase family protein [Lysobacter solisilvae]QSX77943.1 dihydrofolate reductase family protein [Lysobacter solisilvae]
MRTLTIAAMISLDGVMQAPGGPGEDTSGGFAFGGWVVPYASEDDEIMGGALERPFDLVLGRRTYDIFAAYWPHVPKGAPHQHIADAFNGATKHVATHHPETLEWRNSRALGPDIAAAMRELKRTDGPDLLTQGSSELLHQLLATDLVDELRLLVYPVLLGRGKRLFDDGAQASAFRLAESKTSSKGVLVTRYVRDGDVRTGSFG